MASTRYGRIYHSQNHYNNIKFPSSAARDTFAQEFEKYHNSHEHDGDVPRFEMIKAVKIKSYERQAQGANDVTMDGYSWAEIHKYHNREFPDTYTHYRVPTCCISPIIVLDQEFIDSGTLERHELSSIFGDVPYEEFEKIVRSIEQDGFMDPLIRMHESKVLDGWHRYAAALALNIVRKLMFMNWDEEKEGSVVAFVAARNLERRHMTPGQRAQSVVYLNERFGWGGDRSKLPNGDLKTREALAKQANVGTRTIDRAVEVEKAGESKAVISGKKSSSEVIDARKASKLEKQKKQACKSMWDTRIQVARDYTADADTQLNLNLTLPELEKGFQENNPSYASAFASAMKRTSEQSYQTVLKKVLESDVELNVLQSEVRAMTTYAGDIRAWQREDWSPDTNWILPLIEQKKDARSESTQTPSTADTKPDPEPEDTVKTLWEKVTAEMKKWKQRYQESEYRESELVSRASKSQLIAALREYRNSEEAGAATAEELKDLLSLLKSQSYPLARSVRKYLGGLKPIEKQETSQAEQTDAETSETPQVEPDTDSEATEEPVSAERTWNMVVSVDLHHFPNVASFKTVKSRAIRVPRKCLGDLDTIIEDLEESVRKQYGVD